MTRRQARPRPASFFSRFARASARAAGEPVTFALASLAVIAWAVTGPAFGFSDTWQLVINTATTVITFLIVFLIQSTQNQDSAAIQLKLDEIIRSIRGARNAVLDMENMNPQDIEKLRAGYEKLAEQARKRTERNSTSTGRGRANARQR